MPSASWERCSNSSGVEEADAAAAGRGDGTEAARRRLKRRFLDQIEGVRSPAVIEVTASLGKRSRFFILLSLWEPDAHGGAPDRNGQLPINGASAMFVTPFGPTSHEVRDAPDAAELAEETLLWMIDRSRRLEVDAGDVASLLALELVSSLAAYNRAPRADKPEAAIRAKAAHVGRFSNAASMPLSNQDAGNLLRAQSNKPR
jgi:hypothetical protein